MTGWGPMLRTAIALGVAPEAFWRLSLREWRLLTERPAEPAPMGRGDLERMAAAWPDPPPPGRCATTLTTRGREKGRDERDV